MPHRPFPLILATLLVAGVGCRAPAPEALAPSRFGVVRAATAGEAARASRRSDELVPRLYELMPGLERRPIEVWLQPEIEVVRGEPYPPYIAGLADAETGRIYLRDGDAHLDVHLTHELTHVLLGESWAALPAVVEEGVCDLAAALLAGEAGREHRVKRLMEASAFFGGFEVLIDFDLPWPSSEALSSRMHLSFDRVCDVLPLEALALQNDDVLHHATSDEGVGLYGLGFLVVLASVERIGFQGLHALCVRAAAQDADVLPRDWLLDAADLSFEAGGFQDVLLRYVGRSDLPILARLLAGELAASIVPAARRRAAFRDAEEFLREGNPRIQLPGDTRSWQLNRTEEFRAAVRREWPGGS